MLYFGNLTVGGFGASFFALVSLSRSVCEARGEKEEEEEEEGLPDYRGGGGG